jgi:16S rRNA (adenine1518-N6/adenine1519-N6)-dimethyltransferase
VAQTLSEIKALLASRGIHPRHRFGQNFLIDHNKLRQIIDAAQLAPGDIVLEVGPGTGTLTEELLAAHARVIAVEIDRDMVDILRERLGPDSPHFVLIEGDVLADKHHLSPRIAAALHHWAANPAAAVSPASPASAPPFRLIANLPYNVASPLLINLALDWPSLTMALVMVQREVADRIHAPPGGKDFGPMTVILQAVFDTKIISTLSPGCFWPQPQVDSAVIALSRRSTPLTDDLPRLGQFTATLFQKRRKQIGSILGRDFPFPPNIAPTLRPEQLTIPQIIALAKRTADNQNPDDHAA